MRIRLLKDVETLKAGAILFINDAVAANWIEAGLAMEDKSMDVKEHKDGIREDVFR